MLSKFARTALSLAAAIATLAPLHADPLTQYTITAIGEFYGNSLNNNGQVAANTFAGALVWDQVTGIRTLAGATDAASINDLGQVAGAGNEYAASWDASGTRTTFGPQYSAGVRINHSGQVLVQAYSPYAAFRNTGGTLAQLGGSLATGYDMNNLGAIAGIISTPGDQAAVWEAGSLTPTLLPGGGGAAKAINDNGQVAGLAETAPGVSRAVRWNRDSSGVYTQELLSALVPNAFSYEVLNMNDSGAVVGTTRYFDATGPVTKQVLWHADGSVLDITAIAEAAGISGFSLRDINNNGWLLGFGIRDGIGQSFLFKPTVVPEPGFYLSLAIGLGGLWFARRRRA